MALSKEDKAALEKVGFSPAKVMATVRMIVSVASKEKCGKTHWSLGAPDPIAYFNMDVGLEGVIEKFAGKEIMLFNFPPVPTLETQDEAKMHLDRFLAAYNTALGKARTIVIDTGTEVWELMRLAAFGKLSGVKAHHYGAVNMQFRRLIRQAYETPGQNLILIHKVKPIYLGEQRTSEYEVAGMNEVRYDVQVNVTLDKVDGEFLMRIDNARHKPDLDGEEFSGPMCSWDMLQNLVLG